MNKMLKQFSLFGFTAVFFATFTVIFSSTFFCGCSAKAPDFRPLENLESIDPSVPGVKLAPRTQVESHGKKWMVSTQGKYATQEALKVLEQGGNIVDAAIVASLVIGVERPQSTGLGGGGFLIYHEASTSRNYVFDFRERAPLKAYSKMYLDDLSEVIPEASISGALAIAVPGLVRGLTFLHSKFSRSDWRTLVLPAQALAKNGFEVYPSLAFAMKEEKEQLAKFPESRSTFLHAGGSPYLIGERLKQPALARTLGIIASSPEEFYRGSIAKKIVSSVKKHGGMIQLKDLSTYQVKVRKALEATWRGYQIISMPPPSSGGIHVIQILKLLENDPLISLGFLSPKSLHLEAQAMQQAFADRAKYLGDPEFVKVPVLGLIDSNYLKGLRSQFNLTEAKSAESIYAGLPPSDDELNTSHITIMDQLGNVVVTTQTLNGYFGSKLVAEGTGIVLNNEMDDFAAKPGVQNLFGAITTSDANQVEPKKTPLSSMSPTIVLNKAGKPVLALGAPGGTRIISAVAQTILNYLVYHESLFDSVAATRIHEQWKPDMLSIENQSMPIETLRALHNMGWRIKRTATQSNIMAVAFEGDTLIGVADPRDIGTSGGD